MNAFDLYCAFQNVDDDVLQRCQNVKRTSVAMKRVKAAAACLVLILGMAVTAEATTGSVSNLFAPLFGMAQTELVDDIGVPVGVSASADGYTITAEAVIGDRYNIAVVYTLSRDDGQPLPEGLRIDYEKKAGGPGGGWTGWEKNEEDPSKIYFIESWSLGQAIRGRFWAVSFSNLAIQGEGDEKAIIAEGPWELKFTLRYKDTSHKIPVNKLRVSDGFGNDYQINQIWISPVGIYMKGYQFDPEFGGEQIMIHFNVSIVMKDGTVIPLEDHGAGGHFTEGDKKAKANFRAMFNIPLSLEDIASLLICGTEYPVDLR